MTDVQIGAARRIIFTTIAIAAFVFVVQFAYSEEFGRTASRYSSGFWKEGTRNT